MKTFTSILCMLSLCVILTGCTHVTPVYSKQEVAPGVYSVTTGTLVISPFSRQVSNLSTYTVNENDESFDYENPSSGFSAGDGAGIHLIDQVGKIAIGVGTALQEPDETNVGNGTTVKADVRTSARSKNGNVSGTNTGGNQSQQNDQNTNTSQNNEQTASNTSDTDVTANPSANADSHSDSTADSNSNSAADADSSSDSKSGANAEGGDAEAEAEAETGDSNSSSGASANSDPWYDE